MRQFLSLTVLVLLGASGAWGQDTSGIKTANLKGADLKLMKDHAPAVEQANFDLLPGYEVNLFAAEPMLANPIHMVWDSRGRLWVACSWAYPQLVPGEVANDKIIILEDTDDDGKADKSTVFAEGLSMPTGIELANGGCYVAQTPDVFFLKDTDGDDVADVKELALTGFGIEDSHHSISAWRRGPGGWLYFQEGIFLHSQIETQHGMVRNYNGGVYQFNPRTQELRMFARIGVGNPWGHVFDRWGQSFFIDNPRVSYLSPSTGNSGEKVALAKLIQTEKQCGGDLASGTHLPEDIRGQLLTCRFKSRTIIRYELLEDGAGFTANVLPPLIASKHPNFRPVDCKIGPDGAVYVADWYNSIINHAQHDFRDARRDHHHGRIWRITAKGRPLVKKPMLAGAPVTELLDHLKSPESWTRHQARLELSERDRDEVAKALEEWVANLSADDPNIDHHLVEAMWAGQNVERPSETILRRVLGAKDGHARAAGARMIRYGHAKLSDPVALIAKAAADPFPRARMEAVLSAGFVPKAEAFPAALRALDHPRDKFIEAALPQTVKALESYWRPALEAGSLTFAKAEHGDYARRESGIGFDKRLAAFLRNQAPQESEIANIKAQLVAGANAKQVRMVADALTKRGGPRSRDVWIAMLEALEQVGRASEMPLGKKIAPLRTKLSSSDDAIASVVAATLGAWKVQEAGPALLAVLRDRKRTEIVRRAAAVALGALGGNDFAVELRTLAASGTSAERYLAVGGLVNLELKEAAAVAAKLLAQDPGDGDPVVLVMAFVQRAKGTGALVGTLRSVKLHPAVVKSLAEF
ncbi:MAG: PVC-type heme-binding CxxCH protein, partial [Akkermansiaceae bacterium]